MHDAVLGEDRVDGVLFGRIDVGDDNVGVWRDDVRQVKRASEFGEGAAILGSVVLIDDAAHAHIDGAVELAVALFVPAEVVFDGVKLQLLGGLGGDAGEAALDLGAEGVDAHGLHRVFHARVFALGAVAVITLGGDNGLGGIDDVGALHIEERLREEGARAELTVAHAEAAADGDGVAFHFAVHDVRDEAYVLGPEVHVVARLDGDGHLEFAGQVNLAVDRVFAFGGGGSGADGGVDLWVFDPLRIDLLAVEPDIGVGGGAPEEALADFLG